MQAQSPEKLSAADADVILRRLPERIREALLARATEIDYPIEAILEMATRHRGFGFCGLSARTRAVGRSILGLEGAIAILTAWMGSATAKRNA